MVQIMELKDQLIKFKVKPLKWRSPELGASVEQAQNSTDGKKKREANLPLFLVKKYIYNT